MVNEAEQMSKADYIHNVQYDARDYTVPRFGKPQEVKGGNSRPVRSIAFSCDGRRVATGCDTRGLRVWNAREKIDAATSFSLPASGEKNSPHGGHIACLAWSPVQSHILVSGCKSSTTGTYAVVWDVTKPKAPVSKLKLPSDILHISFHPQGSHFAVVCPRPSRDEVYFFHRITADGVDKWVKREDILIRGAGDDLGAEEINSLRFSNSGQYVCAVGNDGSLNAWLYPLERVQAKVEGTRPEIEAGPSRPPTPKRENSAQPENSENPTDDVEMGEGVDGTNGDASETAEGGLGLSVDTPAAATISIATVPPPASRPLTHPPAKAKAPAPQQLRRIKHSAVHSASLLALGLDPTGRYMAIGGQDALLSLLTTKEWICTRTFDISTGGIRYIAFSPDGEMIAFAGDEQAIFIVSVHSGQLISKIPIPYTVNALAWHPLKNWLAYSVVSKGVIVWYLIQQE